jgi:cytochrome c oxidase cbb3-type subunit 4
MSYESVTLASQLIALALFGAVMVGVVIYAFRPRNKARFQAAARLALPDDDERRTEAQHGRR